MRNQFDPIESATLLNFDGLALSAFAEYWAFARHKIEKVYLSGGFSGTLSSTTRISYGYFLVFFPYVKQPLKTNI